MGLVELLEKSIPRLIEKIKTRGDDQTSLYEELQTRDHKDKAKATAAYRFEGRDNKGGHAIWINLWSADQSAIQSIEDIIKGSEEWKESLQIYVAIFDVRLHSHRDQGFAEEFGERKGSS